tara:strand:- start:28 stop:780 length:753 start_codon:yes stop_codon:yes gene_type:complete
MDNLSGVLEGSGYKIKKRKSPTSQSQKMYQKFRKISKNSVKAEKKTNIDLSPKGVIVKVVKKGEEPKKISKTEIVKAKLSPKKQVLKKKSSPKKQVLKKKPSPKKVVLKKKSSSKKQVLKKKSSSKKQVLKKKPSPKKVSPKKKLIKKQSITITNKKVSSKKKKFTKKSRVNTGGSKNRKKSNKVNPFKCYPQNKKNINVVMEKVKQMDNTTIKKELLKDGIEIKSDKSNILRDMYIFSSLGGIKIHQEK